MGRVGTEQGHGSVIDITLRKAGLVLATLLASLTCLLAQQPPFGRGPGGPGPGWDREGHRPPPGGMRSMGPQGRWWGDPALVQKLGISADQLGKIDTIFQQSRLKLIDLSAALHKEEAVLEPLLEDDKPEEARILTQIDRIAQARGELEKANARMLLGFRSVLTQDQWKKLQAEGPQRPPREPRHSLGH